MAQGDEVAGLFGGHDGGDAGDAQHVAFFGGAVLHNGQGLGLHGDAAFGDGYAVGGGFAAYVDHMGLTLGVEVGEFGHVCFLRGPACHLRWVIGSANIGGIRCSMGLYPVVTGGHAAVRINQGIIVGC